MKHTLELNRKYIDRSNQTVKIVEQKKYDLFLGDNGVEYGIVGVAINKGSMHDLIYEGEDGIGKMLHALGIRHVKGDYIVANKRYRPYPVSYRNHYQIDKDDDLDEMKEKGYVEFRKNTIGLNFYFVTDEGKKYLNDIGYKWKEK